MEDRRRVTSGTGDAGRDRSRSRSRTPDDFWGEGEQGAGKEEEEEGFNENGPAVKRRRTGDSSTLSVVEDEGDGKGEDNEKEGVGDRSASHPKAKAKTSGPFIDESDSEEDLDAFREVDVEETMTSATNEPKSNTDGPDQPTPDIPPLVREATSLIDEEYANFDDLDEGEKDLLEPLSPAGNECEEEAVCPICQGNLAGLSEVVSFPFYVLYRGEANILQDVSVHVNDCLDGKTNPPPEPAPVPPDKLTRIEKAAIARPAQRDPYTTKEAPSKSAFSKLMAGNAEDTAWAAAAANEVSSRGKQAYQRTCPFYKIIPNFSICVDAFRYGAVQDCNAYFLSHYHSDHYMGLTSSWCHGPIYCSKVTANLVRQQLKVDPKWIVPLEFEKTTEVPGTDGVRVTLIEANHCPGSALFLFEKRFGQGISSRLQRVLHCGDFRASPAHVQHALLCPEIVDPNTGQRRVQRIDVCYLDTTYMSPKYAFPSQNDVIQACADLCVRLDQDAGVLPQKNSGSSGGMMSQFVNAVAGGNADKSRSQKGRLLVVMGTYSIGKERICLGIARALKCKIYATPGKQRVCACLEDPELNSLLTNDPLEAQIHMQTIFEIRSETLADYLASMKPHFSRVVGFRPTGWSYRPPTGRMLDNPPVETVLHSAQWRTGFSARDLVPQRGSTRESACYGVPYSEHSSFRELTAFCCALRIGRVIPTVNVGSQKSREKMKGWIERWEGEKRRNGLFNVEEW